MKQPADESAEGGENAFAFSASKAARQDIENAGPGRDGQKQRGRKKKQKPMRVEHSKILGTPGISCKLHEWEIVDYKLGFGL
jgi:hypothetical protein